MYCIPRVHIILAYYPSIYLTIKDIIKVYTSVFWQQKRISELLYSVLEQNLYKVCLIFFSSLSNFLFIFKLLLIHLKLPVQIFFTQVSTQVVLEVQKNVKTTLQILFHRTNLCSSFDKIKVFKQT